MPISQPLSRERVIEERDEAIQKLTEPNKSIDSYRCYWEGRKSLADELCDAGQREEKTESDQSKLISKYDELVSKIEEQMCIPTFAKNRNTMILQEIDVLLHDIAALKNKTE
jgi:hypothetical protein